jgi:hypothetical protein
MKTNALISLLLASTSLQAQETVPKQGIKMQFEVEKTRTVPISEEGRKFIIQLVKPPLLSSAPAEVKAAPPVDPVLADQRRAYWRSIAPLETRLLSINAIVYENGISFLSWGQVNKKGEWEQFEAWSATDFSSLYMVPDFEIGRTRYMLFTSVMKATAKLASRRPLPGPLAYNKDNNGYVVVKGDAKDAKTLAPITAIHDLYKTEGAQYARDWNELLARSEAETAWSKANPPPPQDTVVQFWPSKSRRHATAPEAATQPSTPVTR